MTCATCHGERVVERPATPDEVDNGCELGLAYDPCPDCPRYLQGRRPNGSFLWVKLNDDGTEPAHAVDLRAEAPADTVWSYSRTTFPPREGDEVVGPDPNQTTLV